MQSKGFIHDRPETDRHTHRRINKRSRLVRNYWELVTDQYQAVLVHQRAQDKNVDREGEEKREREREGGGGRGRREREKRLPWDQCLRGRDRTPRLLVVRELVGSPEYSVAVSVCECTYVVKFAHSKNG